jgi:hypothetical protein
VHPRLFVLVGAEQEVGQVHSRHRVVGMVEDSLGIDAAGGVDRAHPGQKRSEFIERTEIRRPPAQDIDEGELRLLPPVQRPKQGRALDLGRDGTGAVRPRDLIVKFAQPRFLREPRGPIARIAAGEGHVSFHDRFGLGENCKAGRAVTID